MSFSTLKSLTWIQSTKWSNRSGSWDSVSICSRFFFASFLIHCRTSIELKIFCLLMRSNLISLKTKNKKILRIKRIHIILNLEESSLTVQRIANFQREYPWILQMFNWIHWSSCRDQLLQEKVYSFDRFSENIVKLESLLEQISHM